MDLRTVGTVVNGFSEQAELFREEICRLLSAEGIRILTEETMNEGAAADVILAFGGDGTILKAAQYALRDSVPVLGLNFGRLGFLAEKVPEDPRTLADRLLKGTLREEERMILQVGTGSGSPLFAVNDTVISRGGYARLISLEVRVNGNSAVKMLADGLVIATPTGSTGYSISAGGPIVSPDVNCMTVTPVCPHSLTQRPLVVSGASEITVTLGEDPYQAAVLQLDGQNRGIMKQNDSITVTQDTRKLRVLRLDDRNYYSLVRSKLSEWGTN